MPVAESLRFCRLEPLLAVEFILFCELSLLDMAVDYGKVEIG
jgi:hypothetical protein